MILTVLDLDAYIFHWIVSEHMLNPFCRYFVGDVIFTTTEVISFFEPLHTVNEYRIQGEATALAAGDVDYACLIRLRYVLCLPSVAQTMRSP